MRRTEPFPMDAGMLIIVPSRGRPDSMARVHQAWVDTDAHRDATLLYAVDVDDPTYPHYVEAANLLAGQVGLATMPQWMPMVHKLDACTLEAMLAGFSMVGFMGDDHLPRTRGWASRYVQALEQLGTGIVSCSDGFRSDRLPTQWAMTSDIVRLLGRMVPAPVEHLYCDNAIGELGTAAGCFTFLDEVLIEHMHPLAGKGHMDAGYATVNAPRQYVKDRVAYQEWRLSGLERDAGKIRALREAKHGE